jgi:hypothetical protein
MIRFDDTDWTEEKATQRVQLIIHALTDQTVPDDRIRKVGERRLTELLRAIYEARKANDQTN